MDNVVKNLTRTEAITINKDKCKNSVFLYLKKESPIYEKDIWFISGKKCSNTDTFIMANRRNIVSANQNILLDLEYKKRLQKYKEDGSKWEESKISYYAKYKINIILSIIFRFKII